MFTEVASTPLVSPSLLENENGCFWREVFRSCSDTCYGRVDLMQSLRGPGVFSSSITISRRILSESMASTNESAFR